MEPLEPDARSGDPYLVEINAKYLPQFENRSQFY